MSEGAAPARTWRSITATFDDLIAEATDAVAAAPERPPRPPSLAERFAAIFPTGASPAPDAAVQAPAPHAAGTAQRPWLERIGVGYAQSLVLEAEARQHAAQAEARETARGWAQARADIAVLLAEMETMKAQRRAQAPAQEASSRPQAARAEHEQRMQEWTALRQELRDEHAAAFGRAEERLTRWRHTAAPGAGA